MALHSRISFVLPWTVGLIVFFAASACMASSAPQNTPNSTIPTASAPSTASAEEPAVNASKIPLDVQSMGADSAGALLGFKLKEAVLQSSFFTLTPGGKRFVLRLVTKPEFGDRPYLSSVYAVALFYQEAPDILPYFLDVRCGMVDAENVQAEINAIFDWTSDLTKKFRYLLTQ